MGLHFFDWVSSLNIHYNYSCLCAPEVQFREAQKLVKSTAESEL